MAGRRSIDELGFLRLNPRKKSPLFVQIYEAIRNAILEGKLQPRSKIPSSRDLVEQLHVSRTTVTTAIDRLLAEGYLQTRPGSGTFVTPELPDENPFLPRDPASEIPQKTKTHQTAPRRSLSEFANNITDLQDVSFYTGVPVPFCPGEPALDEFPADVWSKIVRRVWKGVTPKDLSYGEAAGYKPLRRAIAEHIRVHRGVQCSWQQVLIVSGTQQAIDLVSRVLLTPGSPMLFENPGYISARVAFSVAGCQVLSMPIDSHGAVIPPKSKAKVAYVTPSHQFPLGITMPIERRLEFLAWAAANDGWIIEDDYDSEYRYGQPPIPAMQGLDRSERTFYVGSFSKVVCPALGLGYVIVPEVLQDTCTRALRLLSRSPSKVDQMVLAEFIREGHFGRHLRRMRKTHATRREVFVGELQSALGNKLEIIGSSAGLHCTTLLRRKRSDTAIVAQLENAGVTARPLSTYYAPDTPRSERRQGLVFGFACATPAQIRRGLQTVASTL